MRFQIELDVRRRFEKLQRRSSAIDNDALNILMMLIDAPFDRVLQKRQGIDEDQPARWVRFIPIQLIESRSFD